MSVVEDRQAHGWPRGFGSVKRAQEIGRELQPVLRDALKTLVALERGVQGRYRLSPNEDPDIEDIQDFLIAALDGTQDLEVEIIVVARDAGKEVSRNGSEDRSTRDV